MGGVPQKCPVCLGNAEIQLLGGGFWTKCKYCGEFVAASSCLTNDDVVGVLDGDRYKLISVMAERQLNRLPDLIIVKGDKGRPEPSFVTMTVAELLAEYPRSPLEYFDRALLNLAAVVKNPTATFRLDELVARITFPDPNSVTGNQMLVQLTDIGFLNNISVSGPGMFLITAKGWERIEKLRAPGKDSRQAFVAMWFDPSRRSYFDEALKPAIEADRKFTAVRVDNIEHNGKIDDVIVAEIRRSRFVVADFTGDRGSIYFEAGFALGLGLPVIWCVEEAFVAKLPFDIRQYSHIVYSSIDELREGLLNRIRATIV